MLVPGGKDGLLYKRLLDGDIGCRGFPIPLIANIPILLRKTADPLDLWGIKPSLPTTFDFRKNRRGLLFRFGGFFCANQEIRSCSKVLWNGIVHEQS